MDEIMERIMGISGETSCPVSKPGLPSCSLQHSFISQCLSFYSELTSVLGTDGVTGKTP